MTSPSIEQQTRMIRAAWCRQFVDQPWAAKQFDDWLAAIQAEAKPQVSANSRSVANDPVAASPEPYCAVCGSTNIRRTDVISGVCDLCGTRVKLPDIRKQGDIHLLFNGVPLCGITVNDTTQVCLTRGLETCPICKAVVGP